MTITSQKELYQKIKENDLSGFYLIYGTDAEIKRRCFNALTKTLTPENFPEMNVFSFNGRENIEGEEVSSGQKVLKIADAIDQLPLMSEKKLVIIDDFSFSDYNGDDAEKLLELFENKPLEADLIIYLDEEESGKISKGNYKKLAEIARKIGAEVVINALSERELLSLIKSLGKKYNSVMPQKIAQVIINASNSEASICINEAEKLYAIAKDREVTEEDAENLLIIPVVASAFDIIKLLSERNLEKAEKILSNLFYNREPALKILGAIEMGFIDVYRCKLGLSGGKTRQEIASDFGYAKMFRVDKSISLARSFPIGKIRDILALIVKTDMLLKRSPLSEELLMEKLLTEIIMLKG